MLQNTSASVFDRFLGLDEDEIAELPVQMQTDVRWMQESQALGQILDSQSAPIDDRLVAYMSLARHGRKRYRPGESNIPTLQQLGKYLDRYHTTVGDMPTASKVDRYNYNLLLCLAAIYPAPSQGQTGPRARLVRLEVSDAWLRGESISPMESSTGESGNLRKREADAEGVTLLSELHTFIDASKSSDLPTSADSGA